MTEKHLRSDQLRVTHADRQRAVERLGVAMTAGCLTMSEFEERVEAAWAATRRADLDALMRDLPPELAVLDTRGRRVTTARMLPVIRSASAIWLWLSTISLLLWGLACLVDGPHVAAPRFLLVLGAGGALLAPAWHAVDGLRRRSG
jgi:Domain of unknown function (DUF1707)